MIFATSAALFFTATSLTPTQAADLGGDCCADLEERIAELEATRARGRRSNREDCRNDNIFCVKLSGQVNYMLLFWDDGHDTDAYVVDNTESSTRFRFTGETKIRPGWSTDFLIEVEFDGVLQRSEDLLNWVDIDPQPSSPFRFTPTQSRAFFRARLK